MLTWDSREFLLWIQNPVESGTIPTLIALEMELFIVLNRMEQNNSVPRPVFKIRISISQENDSIRRPFPCPEPLKWRFD